MGKSKKSRTNERINHTIIIIIIIIHHNTYNCAGMGTGFWCAEELAQSSRCVLSLLFSFSRVLGT